MKKKYERNLIKIRSSDLSGADQNLILIILNMNDASIYEDVMSNVMSIKLTNLDYHEKINTNQYQINIMFIRVIKCFKWNMCLRSS